MDRRAHQGALDDRAPLQGAIQLFSLESLHPRPEADVHRGRILRLQRAHPVEDLRERRRDALQQHLASEQGSVELPLGQYPASRHLGRAVWLSGGLLAAGLRQNDAARSPQRVVALAPIVLGTSTRMQPAGVDGLLEPIATITPAIAATSSRSQGDRHDLALTPGRLAQGRVDALPVAFQRHEPSLGVALCRQLRPTVEIAEGDFRLMEVGGGPSVRHPAARLYPSGRRCDGQAGIAFRSIPKERRRRTYAYVGALSRFCESWRQCLAAHRGDPGRPDERARSRRAVRRRHAEALVGELDDDGLRRVRPGADRLGSLRVQDGLRQPPAHLRGRQRVLQRNVGNPGLGSGDGCGAIAGSDPIDNHRAGVQFQPTDAGLFPVRVRGDHADPDARIGARPDQLPGLDPVRDPLVEHRLHRQRVPDLGRRLVGGSRGARLLGRLRDPSRGRRLRFRRGGGDRASAPA